MAPRNSKRKIEQQVKENEGNEELNTFNELSKVTADVCETFSNYQPTHLHGEYAQHPQILCEGTALSCVLPPPIAYELQMENGYYQELEGRKPILSGAQMEAITYCMQAHQSYLSDAVTRQGFYLGDGTGSGKTRTLAGIIYEYSKWGVFNTVWLTANSNLFPGISSELRRFFSSNVQVITEELLHEEAGVDSDVPTVLILTYGDLINAKMGVGKHIEVNVEEEKPDYQGYDEDEPDAVDEEENGQPMRQSKQERIYQWFRRNPNGIIVLDDCHFAKAAGNSVKPSQTGQKVVALQEAFSDARVVYSSATAASEPHHLAYLTRLGLWGPGTSFQNLQQFTELLQKRGVGAMELLAMDLKRKGIFVSRQVSYEGVTVESHDAVRNPFFEPVYNMCCEMWRLILQHVQTMKDNVRELNKQSKAKGSSSESSNDGPLYSNSLSFFGMMIMSSKMFTAEKIAREALNENKSVIIGLQNTGERKFRHFSDEKWNAGLPFSLVREILQETLMSMGVKVGCPKIYLKSGECLKIGDWTEDDQVALNKRCINKCVPQTFRKLLENLVSRQKVEMSARVKKPKRDEGGKKECNGITMWPMMSVGWYVARNYPKGKVTPEAISWSYKEVSKKCTLEGLARLFHELSLFLPINPLDDIMTRLNEQLEDDDGYEIAELTGRRYAYEYTKDGNMWKRRARASLNEEMKLFMSGEKRICVISNVASTGINLHAARDCGNLQKRCHITVQLPYGPESLLQQLGRSHRLNQEYLPEYHLVKSIIPGEIRYLSIVNKRLRQLGAICSGQSMANPLASKMSDILCSEIGAKAIDRAIDQFYKDHECAEWAASVGLSKEKSGFEYFSNTAEKRVSRVFNRSLMMPIKLQQQFIDLVNRMLDTILKFEDGSYYSPIVEIPGRNGKIRLISRSHLGTPVGRCTVEHFRMDRTCKWKRALKKQKRAKSRGRNYRFMDNGNEVALVVMERDGIERAVFPWNRTPTCMKDDDWVGWAALNDVRDAEFRWVRGRESLQKHPGCIHKGFFSSDGCARAKCSLKWGTYEILIISGFTSDVLSTLERITSHPLRLARVTYTEEERQCQTAGILVKDNNAVKIVRILNFKYTVAD